MTPSLEYSPYTMQFFLEAITEAASQLKGQHSQADELGPANAGKVRHSCYEHELPVVELGPADLYYSDSTPVFGTKRRGNQQ